ncbi:AAA family ATPase, partial [Candidatus Enterovibrio escicola]|uniref:AAA family ATPase n=1 Tax=Candidatus Enterovibrio escicola TaxID=1927127 RepID=UPI001237FAA1
MKIKKIQLNNIKSFDSAIECEFDENTFVYSISGRNGAGKSTILKSAYLIQKAYFCKLLGDQFWEDFKTEANRFLNTSDSYINLSMFEGDEEVTLTLFLDKKKIKLDCNNDDFIKRYWNLKSPENLILYIDASKGFSEETLQFNELNIADNSKIDLAIEAVLRPEQLFSGIYRQLVKDHVHGRLIPSKPDRLLYFRVASRMFTSLIPNVELKNFSGKHKEGEFVLLGKANIDRRKPLYDVREFSSGEKALLSTLSFLCISKSVCALFIDEPENHFHENLLLEFISLLYALCENGGLLGWANNENKSGGGLNLKEEWLEKEYKDHQLNQVILSTHSKTLIYKIFTMGKNFIVSDKVKEINYDDAENDLRELGLSTIHSKVLLVEGTGDHESLEYILKGKNINIRPLGGSKEVIETFKKLAAIKEHIRDMQFVFLVDSDNKPDEYFDKIRDSDVNFYDQSFIKLSKHEFENYLLDEELFCEVVNNYINYSGEEDKQVSTQDIKLKFKEFADSSLPQVYKKETSLVLNHKIESFFANKLWGN